ncbi:MAG: superoxide dismutase, partial [Gillisia sp.]
MAFDLPKLKYGFDALEPHIDARTMEIHHDKHHAGYTKKLNAAIEGTDLEGKTIENILENLDKSNTAVRNNGG